MLDPFTQANRVIDTRVPEQDPWRTGGIEIHDVGKPQQQPGEGKVDPVAPNLVRKQIRTARARQPLSQPAGWHVVAETDPGEMELIRIVAAIEQLFLARFFLDLLQPVVDAID